MQEKIDSTFTVIEHHGRHSFPLSPTRENLENLKQTAKKGGGWNILH